MTANPLMTRSAATPRRTLDEHVAWLNTLRWVRESGIRYFVREERDHDGRVTRLLDRMDVR